MYALRVVTKVVLFSVLAFKRHWHDISRGSVAITRQFLTACDNFLMPSYRNVSFRLLGDKNMHLHSSRHVSVWSPSPSACLSVWHVVYARVYCLLHAGDDGVFASTNYARFRPDFDSPVSWNRAVTLFLRSVYVLAEFLADCACVDLEIGLLSFTLDVRPGAV